MRTIVGLTITIELVGDRRRVDVSDRSIQPVQPLKDDHCIGIRGHNVGMRGKVATVTESEAVVQEENAITVVNITDLAKYDPN